MVGWIQGHIRQRDRHRIIEIHMYKEAGTSSSRLPGVVRGCPSIRSRDHRNSPRLNPHRLKKSTRAWNRRDVRWNRKDDESTANVTNSLQLQYSNRLSRPPSTMPCSMKGTFSIHNFLLAKQESVRSFLSQIPSTTYFSISRHANATNTTLSLISNRSHS